MGNNIMYLLKGVAIAALVVMTSCEDESFVDAEESTALSFAEIESSVIENTNALSFKLLNQKLEEEEGSFAFSPIGVSLGYGMAGNIVEYNIPKYNSRTYGLPELNKSFHNLLTNLEINEAIKSCDNAIWYDYSNELPEEFESNTMAYYRADVQFLNFDKKDPYEKIDEWHNMRSEGLLNHISEFATGAPKMLISNVTMMDFAIPVVEKTRSTLTIPVKSAWFNGHEIQKVELENQLEMFLFSKEAFLSSQGQFAQLFSNLQFETEGLIYLKNPTSTLSHTDSYKFLNETFISEDKIQSMQMIEPAYDFETLLHGTLIRFDTYSIYTSITPDISPKQVDNQLFLVKEPFNNLIVAEGRF